MNVCMYVCMNACMYVCIFALAFSKTLLNLHSYLNFCFTSMPCMVLLNHMPEPLARGTTKRGHTAQILFSVYRVLSYLSLSLLPPRSTLLLMLLGSDFIAHFPFTSSLCLMNLTLQTLSPAIDTEIASQLTTLWILMVSSQPEPFGVSTSLIWLCMPWGVSHSHQPLPP